MERRPPSSGLRTSSPECMAQPQGHAHSLAGPFMDSGPTLSASCVRSALPSIPSIFCGTCQALAGLTSVENLLVRFCGMQTDGLEKSLRRSGQRSSHIWPVARCGTPRRCAQPRGRHVRASHGVGVHLVGNAGPLHVVAAVAPEMAVVAAATRTKATLTVAAIRTT
jgi:hypothetical protein